jgi:hypothetical protein
MKQQSANKKNYFYPMGITKATMENLPLNHNIQPGGFQWLVLI